MGQEELALLKEIIELLGRVKPVGNKTARDMALQPVYSRLQYLRQRVALDRADLLKYIDQLETSCSGALASRPTLGQSPEQHQIWADNAIRVLKRNLGRFNYSD